MLIRVLGKKFKFLGKPSSKSITKITKTSASAGREKAGICPF
jgi:hypothetical protein